MVLGADVTNWLPPWEWDRWLLMALRGCWGSTPHVYAIGEPRTGVAYVGKDCGTSKRLLHHLQGKDANTGVWVRRVRALGHEPRFRVLVADPPDLDHAETEWMRRVAAAGWSLTNVQRPDCGDTVFDHDGPARVLVRLFSDSPWRPLPCREGYTPEEDVEEALARLIGGPYERGVARRLWDRRARRLVREQGLSPDDVTRLCAAAQRQWLAQRVERRAARAQAREVAAAAFLDAPSGARS